MSIIENLTNIYGDKFTFYPFRNVTRSKILCKCNKCNEEYIRGYNYLKSGTLKCKCEKEKKWTNDKILRFLNEKYNGFIFKINKNIDENGDAEIICICKKCGYKNQIKFRTLRYNQVCCQNCEFVKPNKLKECDVLNFIQNKGYDIISGTYVNEDSQFKIKCKDCGEEFITTYKKLKQQKKGCKNCQYISLRKDDAVFKEQLKTIYNNTIIPLEEYKGINHKIKFKCIVCGNEWYNTIDSVINKHIGCHICAKGVSYPNKFMKNLLMLYSDEIKIEEEKLLNEINNNWLGKHRFDFLITKNDKRIIIEMDGGFHKKENIRKIDEIKNKFAESNNIDIIRIDCDYNGINKRFLTLKNAIINSKLCEILDFSKINNSMWEEIDTKSKTSTYKEIYDFYIKNKHMSFTEIGKVFSKRGDSIKKIINSFKY